MSTCQMFAASTSPQACATSSARAIAWSRRATTTVTTRPRWQPRRSHWCPARAERFMSRSAIAISLVCARAATAAAQRPNQGEDESAAFVEEGRASLRQGKLEDAAKALDQAISLNPRRVEAYVLRSAVYAAKKQYKEGIALMRRAQSLAPNDGDVLTALGS